MDPRVSIIISSFNRPRFLAEAVNSAQIQSFDSLEILVVDDGSTEPVEEVVLRLMAFDSRVRWIPQGGRNGVARTRNRGFEESRGEFVMFFDNDDILDPEKLKLQVATLDSEPDLDCVICQTEFFRVRPGDMPLLWNTFVGDDPLLRFARQEMVWQTAAPLIRRTAYERLGGFDASLPTSDDYGLYYKWLAKGVKYKLKPYVLVHYRRHEGGQLSEMPISRRARARSTAHIQAVAALKERGILDGGLREAIATGLGSCVEGFAAEAQFQDGASALRFVADRLFPELADKIEPIAAQIESGKGVDAALEDFRKLGFDWSRLPRWWAYHSVQGEPLLAVPRSGRYRRS